MKVVHVKNVGTVSIGGVKMEIQYKTRDGRGKDFIKIVKIKEFYGSTFRMLLFLEFTII